MSFHQVDFRVPNTPEGQQFITGLRDYLNRDKWGRANARTRGPRESGPNTQCEKKDAKGFAIYLQESTAYKLHQAQITENAQNYMNNREYKKVTEEYEAILKQGREQRVELRTEITLKDEEITILKEWGNDAIRTIKNTRCFWQMISFLLAVTAFTGGYLLASNL